MRETTDTNSPIPMWLLAEVTYACPLQCPYCSNPLELSGSRKNELDTEAWLDIMRQGRELGAVQLGFSGGEPLVRADIETLVREASDMGYFCNLITSGIGLDENRIRAFKTAGLGHIQISFQGSDAASNARFGGTPSFDHKLAMACAVVEHGLPLGLNFVLHRGNIHQVQPFLEQALALGAEFVELANSQYYGWALHNRDALLPSRQQIEDAESACNQFRDRHPGAMDVFFVAPDYYDDRPKKCSNGWGTTFIAVNPVGDVLPCQSAHVLPGVDIPNVREHSLARIWRDSELFNRFRGLDWMKEPCASCPEREVDLGGCRCQAFLLTGDPRAADPVCSLSPHHPIVTAARERAGRLAETEAQPLVFRNPRNSKLIATGGGEAAGAGHSNRTDEA